jgi:ubiquinol-cytochrome c reductase iron-sulfur subunit
VSALRRWVVAGIVLLLGRGRRPPRLERERVVPAGEPSPRAELLVLALFGATAACSIAFVVVYAVESIPHQTQFLGLSLGLAFAFLAAALIVIAYRLVVTEELEEDYPVPAHPAEQETLGEIVEQSGDRITRKRLLLLGGGAAGAALGAALVTPALSLGPAFEIAPFFRTPWRRGVRLVDERGRPLHAGDIFEETFYTAYPEGADREQVGSPIVVVRLQPAELHLPAGRDGWAPHGIVAYSKICTHAGCAVALYRKPTFPEVEPRPALVCPCHYSTFDPARGAKVLFGPAGRPLPQLPLMVGSDGELRAAGNFSGAVGPAWWGVRNRRPS